MTTLTCPKCQGTMRSYERNGITVDQCAECRGIFLDRGELEHLVEADAKAHAPAAESSARPPAPRHDDRHHDDRHHDDRHHDDRHHDDRHHDDRHHDDRHRYQGDSHSSRRRKSWVDDLFG